MRYIFTTSILCLFVLVSNVNGAGGNHPKGDLPINEGWLSGSYKVVNLPSRVHGYWVNSSDVLFYRTKTKVLNETLAALNRLPGATVAVVLHPGNGVAKSPWSDEVYSEADWSLTIAGSAAITSLQDRFRVDVWLGGGIRLAELTIPDGVAVESGGEIEAFVEQHHEKRAEQKSGETKPDKSPSAVDDLMLSLSLLRTGKEGVEVLLSSTDIKVSCEEIDFHSGGRINQEESSDEPDVGLVVQGKLAVHGKEAYPAKLDFSVRDTIPVENSDANAFRSKTLRFRGIVIRGKNYSISLDERNRLSFTLK